MNSIKIDTYNNFGKSRKVERSRYDDEDIDAKNYRAEKKMISKAAMGLSLITLATVAGVFYFSGGKKNLKSLKNDFVSSQTVHDVADYVETRTKGNSSSIIQSKTTNNQISYYTTQMSPPKVGLKPSDFGAEYVISPNDLLN